jgi:hypothetical protein
MLKDGESWDLEVIRLGQSRKKPRLFPFHRKTTGENWEKLRLCMLFDILEVESWGKGGENSDFSSFEF